MRQRSFPSTFVSNRREETQKWGESFGTELASESIIAFYGSLGAGKTTLIQAMVAAITQQEVMIATSPTYTYLNEYHGGGKTIYHFDLYRMQESEDFIECGFEEYFYLKGICLIEWAERIEHLLPPTCIRLKINHVDETTREIIVI